MLKIKPKQDSIPDIIIGAGSKTTIPMLRYKIDSKTKVISVMKPQFFESKFDLIVAPRHDYKVVPDNVFTYIGSIAKVNINPELEEIGLIVIGGVNKHFNFDDDYLISQINFVISLFPNTNWIVFNSRRTPKSFNERIKKNTSLKTPSQLEIIGYDDISMSAWESYNLTTVRQPIRQMSKLATQLINEYIKDPDFEPINHIVQGRLIKRKTTK